MRVELLVPVLWCLGVTLSVADVDGFRDALRAYKSGWNAETPSDKKIKLADDLLKEWEKLDEPTRSNWEDKIDLVHFNKAEVLADFGMWEKASQELVAEWRQQGGVHGKLQYASRNPTWFFVRLVELQACLTAETGTDPLANAVDYVFERDGEGFTAACFELWNEVRQITVPDMEETEKLVVVHRLRKERGEFVVASTKWLVVPDGKLRDVMKKARREITVNGNGPMVIKKVKGNAGG